MKWTVTFSGKAWKQKAKLPERIRLLLFQLAKDIEFSGPVRGDWPNYSKLPDDRHHCHLKKGHPTYVAVWKVERENVSVEIIYAGTHEKAPY
ncbi:MAG TPA: cytotoxic translational repressor of toxin-antitoxin stability system [Geobacter sp.]|nr:cytotoxic translational repressor of toxin-antitoxin stability system [Geobacter sp.]